MFEWVRCSASEPTAEDRMQEFRLVQVWGGGGSREIREDASEVQQSGRLFKRLYWLYGCWSLVAKCIRFNTTHTSWTRRTGVGEVQVVGS